MKVWLLAAALGSLLVAAPVRAQRYFETTCDPSTHSAELRWHGSNPEDDGNWVNHPASWNGPLRIRTGRPRRVTFRVTIDAPYGECLVDAETPVRIKLDEDLAMAHGQCGADQASRVSLWYGRRHWLRSEYVDGRCDESPTTRIVVDAGGILWCTVPVDREAGPVPETCVARPAASLPGERDEDEYPSDGHAQPEENALLLVNALDADTCASLVTISKNALGPRTDELHLPGAVTKSVEDFVPMDSAWTTTDLDNDGKPERVAAFFLDSALSDAVFLFVMPPEAEPTLGHVPSVDEMWKQAAWVFPSSVAECRPGERCDTLEDHDLLRLHAGDDDPWFFTHSLYATPFSIPGHPLTLILLTSLYDSKRAVVHVTPDHHVVTDCEWKLVPRHW